MIDGPAPGILAKASDLGRWGIRTGPGEAEPCEGISRFPRRSHGLQRSPAGQYSRQRITDCGRYQHRHNRLILYFLAQSF